MRICSAAWRQNGRKLRNFRLVICLLRVTVWENFVIMVYRKQRFCYRDTGGNFDITGQINKPVSAAQVSTDRLGWLLDSLSELLLSASKELNSTKGQSENEEAKMNIKASKPDKRGRNDTLCQSLMLSANQTNAGRQECKKGSIRPDPRLTSDTRVWGPGGWGHSKGQGRPSQPELGGTGPTLSGSVMTCCFRQFYRHCLSISPAIAKAIAAFTSPALISFASFIWLLS